MIEWHLPIKHMLGKELAIRKSLLLTLMLGFLGASAPLMAGQPISAEGRALATMLDGTRVEERWLAGRHVDWLTGEVSDKPVRGKGCHAHCSAFVAAVACRLGIHILRPPEHSQTLLANAQMDWLATKGSAEEWFEVGSGQKAQQLANEGFLVVAGYKNRKLRVSGHIAIVRPDDKGEEGLRNEGPEIIQAGGTNYRSTSLRQGFRQHRGAFERGEIRFFAHAVDPGRRGSPAAFQREAMPEPRPQAAPLVTKREIDRPSPILPGSL